MSSTSFRSRRSWRERKRSNSPGSKVIGVSSRSRAHSLREKTRYGLYCCSGARISTAPPHELLALARGFFFQSRHAGPLRQRSFDIFQLYAARFQQHQQVKQQIGALGDQVVAIIFDRGYHGLHRLLTEFLGAVLRALVEEPFGVGRLCTRGRADIDGGGQIMKGET